MPAKRIEMSTSEHQDVAIVGGGIVGLAVAWRAARQGLGVVLHERGQRFGAETSHVAAGMLAPVTEAEADMSVGYRACGTLVVARDRDEAESLERERALRETLGLAVTPLLPSAARRLEPALAPTLRAALDVPGDHAVDPRLVCAALVRACERAGVELRRGSEVTDAAALPAERVVIAAGPWSGTFGA